MSGSGAQLEKRPTGECPLGECPAVEYSPGECPAGECPGSLESFQRVSMTASLRRGYPESQVFLELSAQRLHCIVSPIRALVCSPYREFFPGF